MSQKNLVLYLKITVSNSLILLSNILTTGFHWSSACAYILKILNGQVLKHLIAIWGCHQHFIP
jgi:hypothetical protein